MSKKYAIAALTSMGLRITPQDRMAVQNSNLFYLQATSAESNDLQRVRLPPHSAICSAFCPPY